MNAKKEKKTEIRIEVFSKIKEININLKSLQDKLQDKIIFDTFKIKLILLENTGSISEVGSAGKSQN